MKLDGLSYAQIKDIYKLCEQKRHDLFKQVPLRKNLSFESIKEVQELFMNDRNPFREEGRLGLVIDRINNLEDEIQLEFKKG
jgi:hypothetical protein